MTEINPGPHICIVEDDAAVRDSLTALLRTLGYPIASFPTAEEFLASPEHSSPSMLIFDLRLPGKSGLELFDEMASRQITPPSVLISGHAVAQEIDLSFWPNEIRVLQKPCNPKQLLEVLASQHSA